jgi:hypothetical protein
MSQSKSSISLTFGVYYGIFGIALVVIQYVTGDFTIDSEAGSGSWFYSALSITAGIAFPILALVNIKKANDGFLTFGQGFKASFTVFIIAALFTAGWMLIYSFVLEPNYQEAILNNAYEQMSAQGGAMTEEQMDQAMYWTTKMTGPLMLVLLTVLTTSIVGGIASLIYAGIMQKINPASIES